MKLARASADEVGNAFEHVDGVQADGLGIVTVEYCASLWVVLEVAVDFQK